MPSVFKVRSLLCLVKAWILLYELNCHFYLLLFIDKLFLAEDELFAVLTKFSILLIHEPLLDLPLLVILDAKVVLRVVSLGHNDREVLEDILNSHTEDTIIKEPLVFETVILDAFLELVETVFDCECPKVFI